MKQYSTAKQNSDAQITISAKINKNIFTVSLPAFFYILPLFFGEFNPF